MGQTENRFLIWLLNLMSLVYKSFSLLHLKVRGLRRKKYPQAFIVSVDNLAFGGTGKTPLVLHLAKYLSERGGRVAVVCRGYRSRYEREGVLVEPGHSVDDVGDEARMLKVNLAAVDVFAGRDRRRSITKAIARGNRIIILDDGFQSTHVGKDFSILLLNPCHPYFYLRGFRFLVKRAHAILFFREKGRVPKSQQGGSYDFEISGFYDLNDRPVDIGNAPMSGFAAVGDPDRFRRDLGRFNLAAFRRFPDHYRYRSADIKDLERWREAAGAVYLVCTEKDMMKIRELEVANLPFLYVKNIVKLDRNLAKQIYQYAQTKGFI